MLYALYHRQFIHRSWLELFQDKTLISEIESKLSMHPSLLCYSVRDQYPNQDRRVNKFFSPGRRLRKKLQVHSIELLVLLPMIKFLLSLDCGYSLINIQHEGGACEITARVHGMFLLMLAGSW